MGDQPSPVKQTDEEASSGDKRVQTELGSKRDLGMWQEGHRGQLPRVVRTVIRGCPFFRADGT